MVSVVQKHKIVSNCYSISLRPCGSHLSGLRVNQDLEFGALYTFLRNRCHRLEKDVNTVAEPGRAKAAKVPGKVSL
jgi:hypothetical protein